MKALNCSACTEILQLSHGNCTVTVRYWTISQSPQGSNKDDYENVYTVSQESQGHRKVTDRLQISHGYSAVTVR